MSSSGPWFNLMRKSLRALSLTLQPDILPSCNPIEGMNVAIFIITQVLNGIPMLVIPFPT